jgi:hypothetical protein
MCCYETENIWKQLEFLEKKRVFYVYPESLLLLFSAFYNKRGKSHGKN